MIMNENAKEIIERRDRRRAKTKPPRDPVPVPEGPGAPVHVDEDGLDYEPDMAPTSAEEDDGGIDLSQANASPATPVLETEDAVPSQTKRRRLDFLKSTSKVVMIDETIESSDHELTMTEEGHVSRRDRIEKSLKAVIRNMIRDDVPMVNMLCNREVLKGMLDELDENYRKNMTKQFIKADIKNTNKDVNQKVWISRRPIHHREWQQWQLSWDSIQGSAWI